MTQPEQDHDNGQGQSEDRASFLTIAVLGILLAAAAAVVNHWIAERMTQDWLWHYIWASGGGRNSDVDLGIFLTNFFVYPILMAIYLGIVLPILVSYRPDVVRKPPLTAAAMLPSTLGILALWFIPGALFWAYTLPAVLCAALATFLALIALRLAVPANRGANPSDRR